MSRDAGALVTELYERYQARDWEAAARVLHPEAQVALPATGEHLSGRDGVIAFQRDYPEPWGDLSVMRVVASTSHRQDGAGGGAGEAAAAELRITAEAGGVPLRRVLGGPRRPASGRRGVLGDRRGRGAPALPPWGPRLTPAPGGRRTWIP